MCGGKEPHSKEGMAERRERRERGREEEEEEVKEEESYVRRGAE